MPPHGSALLGTKGTRGPPGTADQNNNLWKRLSSADESDYFDCVIMSKGFFIPLFPFDNFAVDFGNDVGRLHAARCDELPERGALACGHRGAVDDKRDFAIHGRPVFFRRETRAFEPGLSSVWL